MEEPMTYRVMYPADGWRPRAGHPRLPLAGDEWQVVRQDLDHGQRLYLELARADGGEVRVLVARVEAPCSRSGRQRYRTVRFLHPDEVELVAGATAWNG
jgi:hypothetical protein